jgi:release factor glutamine methyltransferase
MNNSKALLQYLLSEIRLEESQGEIESMAYTLLEHFFKLTHTDVIRDRPVEITDVQRSALDSAIARLNKHEPVQYITGESYFFRRAFKVTPAVLIPRPETEELVQQVIMYAKRKGLRACNILDLGTGSGCIPVTLALEIQNAKMTATDISTEALDIAGWNAVKHNAQVEFVHHDMLADDLIFSDIDVVTSNPPYIRESEKETMHENVLAHEPHLALFVPDSDALLFYRAITKKAFQVLRPGGLLIVEINEHLGHAVAELFEQQGYSSIEIIYDMAQKQRMVYGLKV